jgi:hypothetical protein
MEQYSQRILFGLQKKDTKYAVRAAYVVLAFYQLRFTAGFT